MHSDHLEIEIPSVKVDQTMHSYLEEEEEEGVALADLHVSSNG